MQETYCPKKIELCVQKYWKKNKIFEVKDNKDKEKFYCLAMMPYPSGKLHIGHVRNYTIGDVIARYQRMLGKNVLYPIGWDAFGLPAENAAIKNNISPAVWTYHNISYMRKQLYKLGFSFDWNRELTTCKPEYYRWEQWFFTKLYKKKLAYKKLSIVNWCPQDKTVLANEQVINNSCWRCNSKIEFKRIPQWFLKITNYAEELLNDLNNLKNWPKDVIKMQRNWIGRSEGIEITFHLINCKYKLIIYTTRPDTFMGVTYLMISPQHKLSQQQSKKNKEINDFINYFDKKISKSEFSKIEKKGIYTGLFAIHPLTKEHIPIWISNFILINHGTGAVMAVPAHNQRDLEFAKKYKLKIKPVILTLDGKEPDIKCKAMTNKGNLFNSEEFSGMSNKEGAIAIINKLEIQGIGKRKIHYRLKDWCISRQRYWGAPIPMLMSKKGKIFPVPNKYLPVVLPENTEISDFHKIKEINLNNKKLFFETDTFDTFIESSWYYARYTCPNYNKGMLDKSKANYWLPIDQYIGGIEHATLHLLYFRFFHKLLRDIGLVESNEPSKRLLCQGMVVSETFYRYKNKNIFWIPPNEVKLIKNKEGKIIKYEDFQGRSIIPGGISKMSKSKNNGIDPQELVNKYGADTVRLFIMFAVPAHMKLEWNESGIKGINRFLQRIWKLVYIHIKNKPIYSSLNTIDINNSDAILKKFLHKTIAKVSDDIDRRQSFNTAIASIMELVKKLVYFSQKNTQSYSSIMQESLSAIVRMLAPFTPHISFFLWKKLGEEGDIDNSDWPKYNNDILIENNIVIIIQINGKKRSIMKISKNFTETQIKKYAIQDKLIKKYISGLKIKKIIYVPKKVINLIIE